MTYQHERDEFISLATREGLDLPTCRKLLRYATTLHRLAEAQCNGDWPYNGGRDCPSKKLDWNSPDNKETESSIKSREQWYKRYTGCPKCETPGVARSTMRKSGDKLPIDPTTGKAANGLIYPFGQVRVCPDCRTQELVRELLIGASDQTKLNQEIIANKVKPIQLYQPVFQDDPRGAVLRLATPNYPYDESGKNGARGLYVPVRRS